MCCILFIISIIIILILLFAIYHKKSNRLCLSRKRLEGKMVIVTGGTTGIGFEVAKDLAARGARVIIACPFEVEGINARKQIIEETGSKNVEFKYLDLASLKSVRKFATDIINSEGQLDVLVNSAGVGIPGDFLTADGLNFIMQVNYYGTFLLTLLLLPLLNKTGKPGAKSRIILTGSVLHAIGNIQIDDLNKTNYWNKYRIYGNSKLCLILFANELSKQLKNSYVVVNCVDPGTVATNIFNSGSKFIGFFLKIIIKFVFKDVWEGAQTTLHAVLDTKAGEISGGYFQNCELSKAVKKAYCDKTAEVLWKDSVRLVQLTANELNHCFKTA